MDRGNSHDLLLLSSPLRMRKTMTRKRNRTKTKTKTRTEMRTRSRTGRMMMTYGRQQQLGPPAVVSFFLSRGRKGQE